MCGYNVSFTETKLHLRHLFPHFLRQVRVRRGAQRGLGQQERGRGDGRGEKAGGEQVVENKNYGDKMTPYISAQSGE